MEGSLITSQAQTDCRFFSGYKPCGKNDICSGRCPFKQKAQPRILIVHLEALGAVLRGTLILRAIKRRWPEAHITWVTSPLAVSLLENNPFIDRVIKNNHGGILSLSTLQFNTTYIIDKSAEAYGIVSKVSDPGVIKGFGVEKQTGAIIPLNPEAKRLYELGISNHEKFFVNKKPEGQLLAEALALDYQGDEYVFNFSKEEQNKKDLFRTELGITFGGPVIGLNTGCSDMIPYKKLTVKGWLELIKLLNNKFPTAQLVLLGGPEDTERNLEIQDSSEVKLISTPTNEGLRMGMVCADLCDIIVTGDSLGMHMGIALKKWVVAWFGPTCAHEIDFYGRGTAIKADVKCSPCWKRHCDKPTMCYEKVDWLKITQGVKLGLSKLGFRSPDKILAPSENNLAPSA